MSPDKTQFNRESAVLLGDHPLAFLLLRVSHAGLGLELVEWRWFAPIKKKIGTFTQNIINCRVGVPVV